VFKEDEFVYVLMCVQCVYCTSLHADCHAQPGPSARASTSRNGRRRARPDSQVPEQVESDEYDNFDDPATMEHATHLEHETHPVQNLASSCAWLIITSRPIAAPQLQYWWVIVGPYCDGMCLTWEMLKIQSRTCAWPLRCAAALKLYALQSCGYLVIVQWC
jgi:hypothetical protein